MHAICFRIVFFLIKYRCWIAWQYLWLFLGPAIGIISVRISYCLIQYDLFYIPSAVKHCRILL